MKIFNQVGTDFFKCHFIEKIQAEASERNLEIWVQSAEPSCSVVHTFLVIEDGKYENLPP